MLVAGRMTGESVAGGVNEHTGKQDVTIRPRIWETRAGEPAGDFEMTAFSVQYASVKKRQNNESRTQSELPRGPAANDEYDDIPF